MPRVLSKKEENLNTSSNKGGVFSIIVVIIFIGLIWYFSGSFGSSYRAVYLTSGDIYFGEYSGGFRPTLRDARILQVTDNKETPYVLNRFSDSIWQPEGIIYLNKNQILWTAPIDSEGDLISVLSNQVSQPDNNENISE